jgi:hypothetical protein
VKIAAIAFAAGIVAGLVLSDQLGRPSELERQEALAAVERARDSLLTLPANEVYITDTIPGEPVIRIVRERVTDTVAGETIFVDQVTIVTDTVYVGGGGFEWSFAEYTAAYDFVGSCHANLLDPSLSYVSYSIDVKQRAICPRTYRVSIGGGIYGGGPFLASTIRLKRLQLQPMVGLQIENERARVRWGGAVMWGMF